jgi:hypothetical protein
MKFPITALHQVELTSRCNLRCRYCPSPHLGRSKIDMEEDVFVRALFWAQRFVRNGTQFELNLAGIGESTMHPRFVEWVLLAREQLGPHVNLTLATNGLLVTEEMAGAIAPAKPLIWVSLHRPEKAGPAIEVLKKYGLLSGVSADPALAATDWAGQVNWFVTAPKRKCPWVTGGRVFAMSDGRISPCCIDADGSGALGTVWDDLTKINTHPYQLCRTCDQDVGVPMLEEAHA